MVNIIDLLFLQIANLVCVNDRDINILTHQMAKRTTEVSDRHCFSDCRFVRRSAIFLFITDDKEDGQREKSQRSV